MTVLGEQVGDILTTDMHTIVCPVNTVGVMGKGLALHMAKQIPGLLHEYRKACKNGKLDVGKPWCYELSDDRQILCFATKKHWRNPSEVEWIEAGLKYIAENVETLNIKSLAIPPVGCGLGGLPYHGTVARLLYEYLDGLNVAVEIWVPSVEWLSVSND